jgi:hypothetical protein
MRAHSLLRELSARGVRVLVRGERLSLRGPEDVLTTDFTQRLRQHRPAILEAARHCPKCIECGAAIFEPTAWWGGEPVHRDCGEAAWRRGWQGETLAADAPYAMVH